MRTEIFLLGIIFVVAGPILTAFAFSTCLGAILSGNVFGCITDIAYVVIGGVFFVTGIIMAFIGVFAPDPTPPSSSMMGIKPTMAVPLGGQLTCKKCGCLYDSTRFFCPACGRRPG